MSSQFSLLGKRRFGPFFITQFLGAFNDNLFKNALVVLLTFQTAQWSSLQPELLANLAAGIFMLPFFLFSATAGQLADKFDKARIARLVKLLEIAIMLLAGIGFYWHSLPVLLTSLFFMGLHSTLFGPVKYAILPQHLQTAELVGGNALVEAGTFVAILLGTLAGGLLTGVPNGVMWVTGACLLTAVLGYVGSRAIPAAPAPEPDLRINPNPITETWHNIGFARENRTVFLSILGISWFWLFGALLLAQFPAYAKNVLGGTETSITLLLGVFTFGVGIGSLLCERLSASQVEIGLVPFGSIGLTVFGLDLAFASPAVPPAAPLGLLALLLADGTWRVLLDLFGIGLFGGFFIVPLYALMQIRSSTSHRARIIAANNIVNALFMVVGALAAAGLLAMGMRIAHLFALAALCNAAVAIYIFRLVPEFLLRFVIWMLVNLVYRLHKRQMEHIPEEGAALLVCNHTSYVDALVVAAACRRPIHFVLDARFFRNPVLALAFKAGQAIPADFSSSADCSGNADGLANATSPQPPTYAAIAAALVRGELVLVFPEEGAAASSKLREFQPWISSILASNPVPVIPLALRGLEGSAFAARHSSEDGERGEGGAGCKDSQGNSLGQRLLRVRLFRKIELAAGAPIAPAEAQPERLQQEVARLIT